MIIRVQMNFPFDSALPRDVISINPHYNGGDAQALVDHLKSAIAATTFGSTAQFHLKAYDARKAPPSYPLAVSDHAGAIPTSGGPREVALCLSYFAQHNRPRFRGRLYLPPSWFGSVFNARPPGAVQQAVVDFAQVIGHGLPQGTFWTVYSRVSDSDAQVTDVWCDDEYDTIRSRGLRGTSRVTATVTP